MAIGIGNGIWIGRNRGGTNWTNYWATREPYFALPATGVSLIVGQSVTIYGDELINVPIDNPLVVTYTCDIGTQSGNNYTINPVAGDIGDHALTVVFKNGGYTIATQAITLTVRAKVVDGSLDLLMIGDSTLSGVISNGTLESSLTDVNITFIGTQGIIKKHEGRAGYRWQDFVEDAASPFVKAGVLDIPAYFTDNTIVVPEIVYIRLGVNELFAYCDTDITTAEINTILGYSETLVNAFLAYDAKLKIIIGVPTTAANVVDGWNADYDESVYIQDNFIEIMQRYRLALTTKYAGGVFDARVDCSYESVFIDRNTGYSNGLHPSVSGYQQLGVSMAPYVSKFMTDMFGANLIPAASSHFVTDGTAWWATNPSVTKTYDAGGYVSLTAIGLGAWEAILVKAGLLTVGKNYKWSIKCKSATFTGRLALNFGSANTTPVYIPYLTSSWVITKGTGTPSVSGNVNLLLVASLTGTIDLDDIMIHEIL